MKHRMYHGFQDDLRETFENYSGAHGELLRLSPEFFKLLCETLKDNRVGWEARLVVDAALAYFVAPQDIIPEDEYGAIGYIDDIFLCAYVLNELKDMGLSMVLKDRWDGDEPILSLIDNILASTRELIGDREGDILEFVGLDGFRDVGLNR